MVQEGTIPLQQCPQGGQRIQNDVDDATKK